MPLLCNLYTQPVIIHLLCWKGSRQIVQTSSFNTLILSHEGLSLFSAYYLTSHQSNGSSLKSFRLLRTHTGFALYLSKLSSSLFTVAPSALTNLQTLESMCCKAWRGSPLKAATCLKIVSSHGGLHARILQYWHQNTESKLWPWHKDLTDNDATDPVKSMNINSESMHSWPHLLYFLQILPIIYIDFFFFLKGNKKLD